MNLHLVLVLFIYVSKSVQQNTTTLYLHLKNKISSQIIIIILRVMLVVYIYRYNFFRSHTCKTASLLYKTLYITNFKNKKIGRKKAAHTLVHTCVRRQAIQIFIFTSTHIKLCDNLCIYLSTSHNNKVDYHGGTVTIIIYGLFSWWTPWLMSLHFLSTQMWYNWEWLTVFLIQSQKENKSK